jgi:hypothetical protein
MSMQEHQSQQPNLALTRLCEIEDTLLLCIPAVILVLIVWAIGVAFAAAWIVATLASLFVTLLLALIALALLLRFADLTYQYWQADKSDEGGLSGVACLVLTGLVIATIASAGTSMSSTTCCFSWNCCFWDGRCDGSCLRKSPGSTEREWPRMRDPGPLEDERDSSLVFILLAPFP